jgi:hypothetical protein
MWYSVIDEPTLLGMADESAHTRAEKVQAALNEAESRGFTFVTADRASDDDVCYVFTGVNAKHKLGNIK